MSYCQEQSILEPEAGIIRHMFLQKDTELGMVVETYQQLDYERQKRLLGYMDALKMSN